MVAIVNRRALISGILSSSLCSSSVLIEDVAKFICSSTPATFRKAVQNTNHFLYRGDSVKGNKQPVMAGRICTEEPDLLVSGTYEDETALQYFECLEEYLVSENIMAKPSTGHVATSVMRDARQWGDVVSTWPLGDTISFVYPEIERTFFPDCTCGKSVYITDSDLENSLLQEREVLFASWYAKSTASSTLSAPMIKSSFLAVPQKYDERLKVLLQAMNYGLN